MLIVGYNNAEQSKIALENSIRPVHDLSKSTSGAMANTVEPRYLELAYFELPLISKWKCGPCFNMKLWQQVTK